MRLKKISYLLLPSLVILNTSIYAGNTAKDQQIKQLVVLILKQVVVMAIFQFPSKHTNVWLLKSSTFLCECLAHPIQLWMKIVPKFC